MPYALCPMPYAHESLIFRSKGYNQRFVKIARGSLNETRHWLRLAYARNLLTQEQSDRLHPLLNELSPKLNAYLNSLTQKPKG